MNDYHDNRDILEVLVDRETGELDYNLISARQRSLNSLSNMQNRKPLPDYLDEFETDKEAIANIQSVVNSGVYKVVSLKSFGPGERSLQGIPRKKHTRVKVATFKLKDAYGNKQTLDVYIAEGRDRLEYEFYNSQRTPLSTQNLGIKRTGPQLPIYAGNYSSNRAISTAVGRALANGYINVTGLVTY